MNVVCVLQEGGDRKVLWQRCRTAKSFITRLKGLLFESEIESDEALLIQPCNSVHSLGMRFSIDVIFLDSLNYVLKVDSCLKPHSFSKYKAAKKVLEVAAGGAQSMGLSVGDQLGFYDEV